MISLYIHIPFCKSRCFYCDFFSSEGREQLVSDYIGALLNEIRLYGEYYRHLPVSTVFIGGGTPSHIDSTYIYNIINCLHSSFSINRNAEFSIEANPSQKGQDKTSLYEKFLFYKANGINRLSIGLQAYQDRLLKAIGRTHDTVQFDECMNAAVKAGFKNINVDMMTGLPGQSVNDAAITINKILSFNVKHVSCYSLKLEEGTKLYEMLTAGKSKPTNPYYYREDEILTAPAKESYPAKSVGGKLEVSEKELHINNTEAALLKLPEDETERKMYDIVKKRLEKSGYNHYEISNFSLPGYECRHNINYWKSRNYLGFGASAHSYMQNYRYNNPPDLGKYINLFNYNSAIFTAEASEQTKSLFEAVFISPEESQKEFAMLGFRLLNGIICDEFKCKYGRDFKDVFKNELKILLKKELIIESQNGYKLSEKGLDFANEVFIEFV